MDKQPEAIGCFFTSYTTNINSISHLAGVVKTAIFYLSRTGNTKRFAEAISESIKAPLFDIKLTKPEAQIDYDLLLIGTPVNGFTACPEVFSFVQKLPEGTHKKAILFCTYAIAKGGTFKNLKQALAKKGYMALMTVSKRGIKPNKTDFAEALNELNSCIRQFNC